MLRMLVNTFDFAIVILKIASGINPDMETYWRRRGYNDYAVDVLMGRM